MNLSKESQTTIVNIVRLAAKKVILPNFRNLDASQVQEKTSLLDLVTIADQACERFISTHITQSFPNWAIVGEEAVAQDPDLINTIGESDICLIIDPIDGTWNYAHGLSDFGVIIAVVVKGETRFGLLYDPVHDDWIYANKGEGAYFARPDTSPVPLSIHPEMDFERMIGILSFSYPTLEEKKTIALKATAFAKINNLPSCPAYRQLALGHFHFSLRQSLNAWDHAAGVLIHKEAGGYCRLLDGSEYSPTKNKGKLLVAQSKEQWEKLAQWFEES